MITVIEFTDRIGNLIKGELIRQYRTTTNFKTVYVVKTATREYEVIRSFFNPQAFVERVSEFE